MIIDLSNSELGIIFFVVTRVGIEKFVRGLPKALLHLDMFFHEWVRYLLKFKFGSQKTLE